MSMPPAAGHKVGTDSESRPRSASPPGSPSVRRMDPQHRSPCTVLAEWARSRLGMGIPWTSAAISTWARWPGDRSLVDHAEAGGAATNHLEGDFPEGHVDLAYEFRLADGRITHLAIAP